jgi:L-alanine-DL-glutamate epimerase-like enolase superfamily enzyme
MTESTSANIASPLTGIAREPIKITDVRTTRLTYQPAAGSYVHECGPVVLTQYDIAIVEVFTDQGITGIGPAEIHTPTDQSHLIGQNPFDVVQTRQAPGVDVACWDIIGKARGKPVYQLLAVDNTPNPTVHVYASGGVLWTFYDKGDGKPYGADALIEEALRYKAMGFDAFKWRPGTDWEEAGITPTKLGDVCRKLREAVGPDFKLGLEKKGYDSWTFEECLEIAPIIDDLGFFFFEQPMGDEGPAQFEDYLRIKERMPRVMLWGGERIRSLAEARPWLERRVYDAIQTDCLYIGLSENWRIARAAAANGVKLVPHNWSSSLGTMSNVHLVAGVPSGCMCEFFLYPNPFREGLFVEPYRPVNGTIALSGKPGFGMELLPVAELAKRFPHVPGPNTIANPRFPHAWPRARAREAAVAARYSTR